MLLCVVGYVKYLVRGIHSKDYIGIKLLEFSDTPTVQIRVLFGRRGGGGDPKFAESIHYS
jgi:hypothetical protein